MRISDSPSSIIGFNDVRIRAGCGNILKRRVENKLSISIWYVHGRTKGFVNSERFFIFIFIIILHS